MFKNADAAKLKALIAQSLGDLKSGKRPEQLKAIRDLYGGLDRGALDGVELIELKYLMTNFRAAFAHLRVKQVENNGAETAAAVEDLALVGPFLEGDQAKALLTAELKDETEIQNREAVVAEYADSRVGPQLVATSRSAKIKRLAGPVRLLPHSGPPFVDKYDNNRRLDDATLSFDGSQYEMTGKYSARVRGVDVRSGHIFILDQGVTAGINTSFSRPRSYASHSRLIVFVEKNGKVYPTFFEIAERDARVIPLNVAFGPAFNSTGEVYRVVGRAGDPINANFDGWAKALSQDVLARLKVKHYYDYAVGKITTGEETDLVCSTQVQAYLLRAHIKLDLPLDKVDEIAEKSR